MFIWIPTSTNRNLKDHTVEPSPPTSPNPKHQLPLRDVQPERSPFRKGPLKGEKKFCKNPEVHRVKFFHPWNFENIPNLETHNFYEVPC